MLLIRGNMSNVWREEMYAEGLQRSLSMVNYHDQIDALKKY